MQPQVYILVEFEQSTSKINSVKRITGEVISKNFLKAFSMARFTVLEINQILSQRWGIISASLITPPHSFYTTFSNYFIVFFLFWSTIASIQFVMNNYDDLFLSLQTCAMIIGGIQSVGMYIGIGIYSDKVTILHAELQSIVDQGIFISV